MVGDLDGHDGGQQAGDRIAAPDQGRRNGQADGDTGLSPQHSGPAGSGAVRAQERLAGAQAGGVVSRQTDEERETRQSQRSYGEEDDRQGLQECPLVRGQLCPGGGRVGVLKQVDGDRQDGHEDG